MTDQDAGAGVVELKVRQPRVSGLMARIDAGEPEAVEELERRLRDAYRELVAAGEQELADAAWGWGRDRVEDVERAEDYAEYQDVERAEAPACWTGLRIRVSYLAGGGTTRPSELAGRLAEINDKGILVLIDDLHEERDAARPGEAGTIVRRVRTERFVSFGAVLSVQPLPVRQVRTLEASPAL
ncbi:MAG: hypothetical protein M3P49_06655 [Actinomycetota bacterium]|nr:hypothetical protein [Actinomycetota bacterium]